MTIIYGGYDLADLDNEDLNGKIKPFNESPVKRIQLYNVENSGSIDTSSFDQYRQGIELTLNKYYYNNLVKIHSGEQNHRLKQTVFGVDVISSYSEKKYFQELDYFDAVDYLKAQETVESITDYVKRMTYPIISPDVDESENYCLNGIIEPLTIRSKVSFFSIESPFESHDVRGEFESGNHDSMWSNDQIVLQKVINDNNKQPYLDIVDVTNNGNPLGGFFIWEKSSIKPFSDNNMEAKSIIISLESESFRSYLLNMNPDTETYIPNNKVSLTNGFTYDNIKGTDSISYGDSIYVMGTNPYIL